jgi:hypothetical protein
VVDIQKIFISGLSYFIKYFCPYQSHTFLVYLTAANSKEKKATTDIIIISGLSDILKHFCPYQNHKFLVYLTSSNIFALIKAINSEEKKGDNWHYHYIWSI